MKYALAAFAALVAPATAFAQTDASPITPFVLTTPTYAQNFNGLAATGTSNVLPAGFQITETGTGGAADGFYAAGTGSSNAGNAYSFGAAGSTDRALGSLTSGGVSPIRFGGVFTSGLPAPISSLAFAYTGEQWRLADGASALLFEYSLDATSLLNGSWIRFGSLDFAALRTNGAAADTAVDGNAAANRRAVSGTIGGLSIATGGRFGFRWTQSDVTGSDQGLAVDDLSISALGAPVAAVPEPATWLTMLLGFFLIGAGLRRRSSRLATV